MSAAGRVLGICWTPPDGEKKKRKVAYVGKMFAHIRRDSHVRVCDSDLDGGVGVCLHRP